MAAAFRQTGTRVHETNKDIGNERDWAIYQHTYHGFFDIEN